MVLNIKNRGYSHPLFYCGLFILLISISCTANKRTAVQYYTECQNIIQNKEWISFDVISESYEGNELSFSREPVHIIIHRNPDYLVLQHFDYAVLISPDSVSYIHYYNREYACYRPNAAKYDYYGMLCGDEIGNNLDMLSIYSRIIAQHSWIDSLRASSYVKTKGRYYYLSSKMTVKYCSPHGCSLHKVPVQMFFDTVTSLLDSTASTSKDISFVQKVKGISFAGRQGTVDSLFLDKDTSRHLYSIQNDDSGYVYSRSTFNITTPSKSFIDHPFVNARTGDTMRLSDLSGKILLCIFKDPRYDLKDLVLTTEKIRTVDNIIFVAPYSNHIETTVSIADSLGVSKDVYCAKGLSRKLSMSDRFILISENKTIKMTTNLINEIAEITE